MLTKQNIIKCDVCGKFIKLADLVTGSAIHSLYTPDSDLTKEVWESYCAKCIKKMKAVA